MESGNNIFFFLFLFAFGVYSFFFGFSRLRRKRLIENIPTSTIRGVALGLVEIYGKARSDRPLKSPLTKTECVLFRFTVERYERRGKSSRWVTIARGESLLNPFWLEDSTGTMPVFPRGAELMLGIDYEFTTGWGKTIPQNIVEFLEENTIRYRGFFGSHTLRFREWYIRPQDETYVLGTAKKTGDTFQVNNELLNQRLRALKENPARMAACDTNQDGDISPEEWQKAVEKVEQAVLEEQLKNHGGNSPQESDVIVAKGDTEKVFIISDRSQKELVQALFWQAIFGIYGGGILALFGLWLLLGSIGVHS